MNLKEAEKIYNMVVKDFPDFKENTPKYVTSVLMNYVFEDVVEVYNRYKTIHRDTPFVSDLFHPNIREVN